MITVEEMVSREVHYCVSSLVYQLAGACGEISAESGASAGDVASLCEAAMELSSPVPDYEEALIQEGYTKEPGRTEEFGQPTAPYWSHPEYGGFDESAEDICDFQNIDPHDREVFEHWIVSDWLADKLSEHGEKIDKDFAGLTVWARTTTGQAISQDYVIQQIHKELTRS